MIERLDHLVNDESDGLAVELAVAGLLQHVEQRLLHELEDHEHMVVASFSLLAETSQQLDDIWVAMEQFQERYLSLRDPLGLETGLTGLTYKGIRVTELLDGHELSGLLV